VCNTVLEGERDELLAANRALKAEKEELQSSVRALQDKLPRGRDKARGGEEEGRAQGRRRQPAAAQRQREGEASLQR